MSFRAPTAFGEVLVVYFTMFSKYLRLYYTMLNNELERNWKEDVVA
jgi:hypothetical protein